MQKVFDLTNKYIILIPILLLYSIFSGVFITVSVSGKFLNLIFAILLFGLMTSAFTAGWLNIIKNIILEKCENTDFMGLFPEGVGEYFLPVLGALINIIFIFVLNLFFAGIIGINFIGNPEVSPEALSKAMVSTESLKQFVASLTPEQIIKINLWDFLILGFMGLSYLLTFLYIPALFFTTKNPYKAYIISIKNLFSKSFFKTLGLFLAIVLIHIVISISTAIMGGNSIFNFIITFINFYIVTVISIGIFYYYNVEFVKSKLGQNIDITL